MASRDKPRHETKKPKKVKEDPKRATPQRGRPIGNLPLGGLPHS